MRTKDVILLSVSAFVCGVAFYFACKYTYQSQLDKFKTKTRVAFIDALNQELKSRKINGPLTSSVPVSDSMVASELPDSVCIIDSLGEHWYQFDSLKHSMNVTPINDMRHLHSYTFGKKPLVPDSLNSIWQKYLSKYSIPTNSALQISVMNERKHVTSEKTSQSEWCNISNSVFTVYLGYANEIEVIGYIHYSLWNKMLLPMLLYILLYIGCVYGIYKLSKVKREKIVIIPQIEIVEVPVVKMVKMMNDTPVRSYLLRDNILFNAEEQKIEWNGVEKKLQNQASQLLELFLQNSKNEYILEDSLIMQKLWPNEFVNSERLHKALARLRSNIREVDSKIDIKRGTGTYQLLL